jgi:hypothetical protein
LRTREDHGMTYIKTLSMKFAEFKTLDLYEQAGIICESGVMLAERSEDDNLVVLYAVESFYVEIFYRNADSEIIKFRSFQSVQFLEPYFEQIDIDPLVLCY